MLAAQLGTPLHVSNKSLCTPKKKQPFFEHSEPTIPSVLRIKTMCLHTYLSRIAFYLLHDWYVLFTWLPVLLVGQLHRIGRTELGVAVQMGLVQIT